MPYNEKSKENLKPFTSNQSREAAKKNGSKGGKATARNKQAKKRRYETWKELGEIFLPMALKEGDLTEISTISDVDKKANITAEEAIFFSLLNKAMKGDVTAIRELFDMTGWNVKPTTEEEEQSTGNTFINALEGKASEAWDDVE